MWHAQVAATGLQGSIHGPESVFQRAALARAPVPSRKALAVSRFQRIGCFLFLRLAATSLTADSVKAVKMETSKNRRQPTVVGLFRLDTFPAFLGSSDPQVLPEGRSKAAVPANGQALPTPSGQTTNAGLCGRGAL